MTRQELVDVVRWDPVVSRGFVYCAVVTYRSERPQPRECVVDGAWPFGELRDDAPPSAAAAQRLVVLLREHMQKPSLPVPWSARALAAEAGVAPATVTNTLNGVSWCDIDTLARLEQALGASLWDHDHLTLSSVDGSDHNAVGF